MFYIPKSKINIEYNICLNISIQPQAETTYDILLDSNDELVEGQCKYVVALEHYGRLTNKLKSIISKGLSPLIDDGIIVGFRFCKPIEIYFN